MIYDEIIINSDKDLKLFREKFSYDDTIKYNHLTKDHVKEINIINSIYDLETILNIFEISQNDLKLI